MEDNQFQQFQTQAPTLAGGESSSADEAFLNSVCDGISFRSLLTYGSFEPSAEALNVLSGESQPYNLFSDAKPPSLPSLLSYEQPLNSAAAVKSPIPNPRVEKTASYTKHRYRQRQQRRSDKTRCLQKLLPWDGKVDMATVLEESYKYIKFLRAQVSVLQSMPCESNSSPSAAAKSVGGGGMLGKLNRQQLLQVAVSSPAVQAKLYSKGCCLYSVEQLMLLKKKALYHRMISDSSVNPNFFLSRN